MDPRQQAIQAAMQANSDPALIAALRDYQTTGKPPTDPRVVAILNQAFQAHGVPPLAPPNGPFATQAGDPANRAANQQAQATVAAVTPAQATGGSDPGREANRTAATPAPGAGLPSSAPPVPPAPPAAMPNAGAGPAPGMVPSTGPGSPGNLQNAALGKDNYNFAFAKLMDMIGLAPGQQGAFGKTIANTLLPLFQAYMGTDGLAQGGNINAVDNRGNALNQFAQMIGGDKGLMGQLQGIGQGVVGAIGAHPLNDPAEEQRYMTMATALTSAGENPLIRQSVVDQLGNSQYAYEKAGYDGLGNGTAPSSYIKWLQGQQGQDGGQFSDIIRLFGGR